MKHEAKHTLKSIALALPIYATLVWGYIVVVLRFLEKPLSEWYKTDRRFYAAAALGLIIGQGFILELVTRFLERALRKTPGP